MHFSVGSKHHVKWKFVWMSAGRKIYSAYRPLYVLPNIDLASNALRNLIWKKIHWTFGMRMVHKIGFDFIMLHYTEIGQNEKTESVFKGKMNEFYKKNPSTTQSMRAICKKKNISHEIQTVDEKRMVKVWHNSMREQV